MKELTLARYILELSLLDYDAMSCSESKLAIGSLYIALRMCNEVAWDANLQFFSGKRWGFPTNKSIHNYETIKLIYQYLFLQAISSRK